MKQLFCLMALLFWGMMAYTQINYEKWEEESKTNKRLLPRYGQLPKTGREKDIDSAYVKEMMEQPQFTTRRQASDHLIQSGFQYYYRKDFKTAMYRFNQAYLLDTGNTDIFWGYGAIYMGFGQFEKAKKQYEEGLALDSTNTHLLTDMGSYFMGQYYGLREMPAGITDNPEAAARRHVDSAILYLNKSYLLNSKDVNTTYKLSICYWIKEDCHNAWKYYDEAVALGGQPITKEYTDDLKKLCEKK